MKINVICTSIAQNDNIIINQYVLYDFKCTIQNIFLSLMILYYSSPHVIAMQ